MVNVARHGYAGLTNSSLFLSYLNIVTCAPIAIRQIEIVKL